MLSFFKNSERDKKITVLKNQMQSLKDAFIAWENSSIVQILSERIGKIEFEFADLESIQDMVDDRMVDFDERLKKMEYLINMPSNRPEVNSSINTTATNAILDVLLKEKNGLSFNDIFSKIKEYNLKNPNITRESFKSLLYGLRREGRVDYGKKEGTFKGVPRIYS